MSKNNESQQNSETKEVLVTNGAIKATDTLMCVGAGLFAIAGLGALAYTVKKNRALKEQEQYKMQLLMKMKQQGYTDADILAMEKIL